MPKARRSATRPEATLDLVDWRRRVFEIYRAVRLADDPAEAWVHWRRSRDDLFKTHPQSPLPVPERAGFQGLSYFDYDPAARAIAEVVPVDEPSVITFEANEGTLELELAGRAGFELYGKQLTLDLYWFRSYGGGLFVSFRDLTSGNQTYGGARYLLDTVKGADLGGGADNLVFDFNFAYQPSCAYDAAWVCPLAPVNNRLNVPIRAGERWNKA